VETRLGNTDDRVGSLAITCSLIGSPPHFPKRLKRQVPVRMQVAPRRLTAISAITD
jgi:hypothetical protein